MDNNSTLGSTVSSASGNAQLRDRWIALTVLCLGELMIVLDSTIVNVALPSIRTDLQFTETSLAWVVNAYMLTYGGFLLLGGLLTTISWHWIFLVNIPVGIVVFGLATVLLHPNQAAVSSRHLDVWGAITVTGSLMAAINEGYQVAFMAGAVCALIAAVLGAALLRSTHATAVENSGIAPETQG